MSNSIIDREGRLIGRPLAPHKLDVRGAVVGTMGLDRLPGNPDVPGIWSMLATAQTMSLQVVSTVPEPGRFGMLLTGVLALGLWRRWKLSST